MHIGLQLQWLLLFWGFVTALSATAEVTSDSPLRPYQALYTGYVLEAKVGEIKRHLSKEEEYWVLFSEIYPTGIWRRLYDAKFVLYSHFVPEQDGIDLLQFNYWREIKGEQKRAFISVNKQQQRVVSQVDSAIYNFDNIGKFYDVLSYQWQLRRDLMQGKRELQYQIVDEDEIKHYRFAVTGEDWLELPTGRVKALRLQRTDDPDRPIEFWAAITLDYLIVKVEWNHMKVELTSLQQ